MKKQNKVALRASASPRETSTNQVATTALTVRLNEIVFPKGVETLGQKANFLHGYFVEASKRAKAVRRLKAKFQALGRKVYRAVQGDLLNAMKDDPSVVALVGEIEETQKKIAALEDKVAGGEAEDR